MLISFLVLLLSSCMHTPHDNQPTIEIPLFFEAFPTGAIDYSKISDSCPNFTGTYKSSTETTYVTQYKCEKITISQESPVSTRRNTYYLDGSSITVRKYLMHSVPYRAVFNNDKLIFQAHGENYTNHEQWELISNTEFGKSGISQETVEKHVSVTRVQTIR